MSDRNVNVNINLDEVVQANEQVRKEVKSVKNKIGELQKNVDNLNKTTDKVREEIEFQTKLQKELELVDAEANLTEAQEMEKIERTALISAEDKLAQSKADIVRDFVKGIRDQITQFKNLIANELERLINIISGREKVEKLIRSVDPLKDDKELIAETRNIYSNRQNLVISPMSEISTQVEQFVQDRKNLKQQIEDLIITNPKYNSLKDQMRRGDIFIMEIPLYVAGFSSQPIWEDKGSANMTPQYYRYYSSLTRAASHSPSETSFPNQLQEFDRFMENIETVMNEKEVIDLLRREDLMQYELKDEFKSIMDLEGNKYIRKAIQDHYYGEDY